MLIAPKAAYNSLKIMHELNKHWHVAASFVPADFLQPAADLLSDYVKPCLPAGFGKKCVLKKNSTLRKTR